MVSVIVPVYNARKYLPECLNSLEQQTCKELEIILVDDRSTDGSDELCAAFCRKNPEHRIFLRQETNRGPSAARNRGILAAHGEYIGFTDADDRIAPVMFEQMERKARQENLDIVECGVQFLHPDGTVVTADSEAACAWIHAGNDCGAVFLDANWSVKRIYRREFLQSNQILFDEDLILFEDVLFAGRIFAASPAFGILSEPLYQYRQNIPDSLTAEERGYEHGVFRIFSRLHDLTDHPETSSVFRDAVQFQEKRFLVYGYGKTAPRYRPEFWRKIKEHAKACPPVSCHGIYRRYWKHHTKLRTVGALTLLAWNAAFSLRCPWLMCLAYQIVIRGNLKQRLHHPVTFLRELFK